MFYEVLGDEPVTPEKKAAIQEILGDNQAKKNLIVCSVLTHLEVIPSKIEAKKPGAETQYLGIFDGEHFVDIEISRNILMRAREIREYYYRPADPATGKPAKVMDAADAAHLATATIYNVDEFHTRDDDDRDSRFPSFPCINGVEWTEFATNTLSRSCHQSTFKKFYPLMKVLTCHCVFP
ncbi:hypothetical protein, partial [Bradyrhizobium yuanmingense]|uniref:hypothetical protein n=2 Tax=Bradyrhizobium TaxID=374 RepID=UPI00138B0FEB